MVHEKEELSRKWDEEARKNTEMGIVKLFHGCSGAPFMGISWKDPWETHGYPRQNYGWPMRDP